MNQELSVNEIKHLRNCVKSANRDTMICLSAILIFAIIVVGVPLLVIFI